MTPAADRSALSERELRRFAFRLELFQSHGWTEARAEAVADKLVARDRALETRWLCVECEHLTARQTCARRDAVLLEQLQRCPNFAWRVPA